MATRAERFRAREERKGPKATKGPKGAHAAKHTNVSKRAGHKATYALEPHAPRTRPSRKSTRSSANRSKPDANFQLREERRTRSPKARATKRKRARTAA